MVAHPPIESRKYYNLEHRTEPWLVDETSHKEGCSTEVVGLEIGPLHHRQTAETILLAHLTRRIVAKLVVHTAKHGLKMRSLGLLGLHIWHIPELAELLSRIVLPRKGIVVSLLLNIGVAEREWFVGEHEEMHVTIVVGQAALAHMTHKAIEHEQQETYPPPLYRGSGDEMVEHTEEEDEIDGNVADIRSHAIEYASHGTALTRHTSKLTIGTVVEIAYGDENHAQEIHQKAVKVVGIEEQEQGTDDIEDHRHPRDKIWCGMHPGIEPGELKANGASEDSVEPLFGVGRLAVERIICCHFFYRSYGNYGSYEESALETMAWAASSRHGEKLGQSLMSMICTSPSGETMASPP